MKLSGFQRERKTSSGSIGEGETFRLLAGSLSGLVLRISAFFMDARNPVLHQHINPLYVSCYRAAASWGTLKSCVAKSQVKSILLRSCNAIILPPCFLALSMFKHCQYKIIAQRRIDCFQCKNAKQPRLLAIVCFSHIDKSNEFPTESIQFIFCDLIIPMPQGQYCEASNFSTCLPHTMFDPDIANQIHHSENTIAQPCSYLPDRTHQ